MAIDSVTALLDPIRQHQLLEPGQYSEVVLEARKYTDPRALAQHLIKKNWLTAYQVNQIFAGAAGSLVLGQYRLLERIGEGGMGQVFKARHQALGRIVALKVIRKDKLENAEAVKRFRREIEMAAKLSHPNVVLAFDADTVSGTHFYAMEYVDGIDLSRLIKQQGPLPLAQACDFIRQAAQGLQHAHEVGVVHRDIKPSNLLVTRPDPPLNGPAPAGKGKRTGGAGNRPLIKILDMGLARLALAQDETAAALSISQAGTVMGTPDFMAPEQAKNSARVDWRADIYSLGCTFYYLLTAQVPYPGGTNIEKLIRHQMDSPKPIEQLRPDVPPPVRAILQRMMAKRPEDRFQTAGDVAAALAPYCDAGTPAKGAGKKLKHDLPLPVPAGPPPSQPRPIPSLNNLTTSFSTIRNLFFDPQTHKPRRLAVAMVAAILLSIVSVFFLLLAVVSEWGTPAGSAAASQKHTPPPSTGIVSTPPATTPKSSHLPITRHLPAAANNIWVFKVPDVFQASVIRQNDNLIKGNLSPFFLYLQPLGIDLYRDVDRAAYTVIPTAGTNDLFVVIQGTFDQAKYQEAISRKPRPIPRKVPQARGLFYYEHPADPSDPGTVYMTMLNSKTFIFTSNENLLVNALLGSVGQRPAELADREVQRQLENLDDKPSMFLAIGGSFTTKDGTPLSDVGIRCLTCGFQPGNDMVQAEYKVLANDNQVFQQYKAKAVPFFTDFLRGLDHAGVLTAGLAGAAIDVNERDNILTLRTRYNAKDAARYFRKGAP